MDYCSTLWGNANSPERIYKLQRRAARITANCKCRAPSDPLLKQLNWLPRSVYIPFFPFSFSNLRTKNEKGIRFSFANLKTKNQKGIRYPFFVHKFEKKEEKRYIHGPATTGVREMQTVTILVYKAVNGLAADYLCVLFKSV